ncbi:MAG: transcriptional regulator [Proteobacteria bacterium]|jgi:IclR family mhp operon transcriptional activator|nr:transcriptional regulator [Pseudomonadota bacterium]
MSDSTRPIRALIRGLDALKVLNLRDGATVSEVSTEIRLPRTTTYRVLETLCEAGYVFRDPADDRYRLTLLVRGLSDGFDDEAWVSQIARPVLHELGREVVWPVAIATLSGTTMMLRETTDHRSPLAIERYAAGSRVPLLTSAAGRAYLAWCPTPERETLVDILSRSARDEDRLARNPGELARILAEVRAQGYASAVRARRVSDEVSLAAPVTVDDRLLACLTVRFSAGAVPMKAALDRLLPRLFAAAERIGGEFAAQQRAGSRGRPR